MLSPIDYETEQKKVNETSARKIGAPQFDVG
jgi:hypothetical protein